MNGGSMKFVIFSLVILSSSLGWSNSLESVFRKDTHLPVILQEKLLHRLKLEIKNLSPFSLREINTELRVDRVDQGVIDYYYTTNFEMSVTCDFHPTTAYLTVKSAEFSFYCQNNCNIEILDIKTQGTCE